MLLVGLGKVVAWYDVLTPRFVFTESTSLHLGLFSVVLVSVIGKESRRVCRASVSVSGLVSQFKSRTLGTFLAVIGSKCSSIGRLISSLSIMRGVDIRGV